MPVYVCISFVTYEHPLYRFIVLHRGRFVYCPFLLVRFISTGGFFVHRKFGIFILDLVNRMDYT